MSVQDGGLRCSILSPSGGLGNTGRHLDNKVTGIGKRARDTKNVVLTATR